MTPGLPKHLSPPPSLLARIGASQLGAVKPPELVRHQPRQPQPRILPPLHPVTTPLLESTYRGGFVGLSERGFRHHQAHLFSIPPLSAETLSSGIIFSLVVALLLFGLFTYCVMC
ncbi:hypothetical protein E2C01_062654 [Portunus trituberculatus]|uniref:Uncharacterized protein n=1 Tax=Portunus trituberculatus TaxID=210409 RepID=A0A5B7HBP8_PORTR|nr:hypothetical protein [Portunus trituberculatus]